MLFDRRSRIVDKTSMGQNMQLLVFDLGHVLIDFEWMSVCYAFSERCNLPNHEILRVFSEVGSLGYERGKISTAQFIAELNQKLSCSLDVEEFRLLWNTSFRENKTMVRLLEGLSKNYELCILSNTNECHYEFIQDKFDVERHFKDVVLSYRVGHNKPSQEIYQAVVDKFSLSASECLFVDDLEENIEAARRFGMNAVLFSSAEKLSDDLTAYGVKLST